MTTYTSLFFTFLNKQDDAAWSQTITGLWPSIHPVDQPATRIWFSFFPLRLRQALNNTDDLSQTVRTLKLQGRYRLEEQVDTSAEFLYGHRYWAEVKRVVADYAAAPSTPAGLPLSKSIRDVAHRVAETVMAEESLLVGITAVAFMTLQQVGYAAFIKPAAPNRTSWTQSADQVLKERNKVGSTGWLDFLKLGEKEYTVTFHEKDRDGFFKVINQQEMASGAARDQRDYRTQDARCIEGPIPVECRSAACGSCWVGILAGNENLGEPTELEVKKMKEFGYPGFSPSKDSMIRLACQARCFGNASIVIPPWNGVIGKLNP